MPNIILPGASALLGSGISLAVARWAFGRAVKKWDQGAQEAREALSLAKNHGHPEFVRADICNTVRDGCGKERAAVLGGIDDKLGTIASIQQDLRRGQDSFANRLGKIEADVEHIKKNGGAK